MSNLQPITVQIPKNARVLSNELYDGILILRFEMQSNPVRCRGLYWITIAEFERLSDPFDETWVWIKSTSGEIVLTQYAEGEFRNPCDWSGKFWDFATVSHVSMVSPPK